MSDLSLVARYDDLLRTQLPLLAYQEPDFLRFVQNEINVRQTIRSNSGETDRLKRELSQANNERKRLELMLTQVRRELEEEMLERKRLQNETDQLSRQMQVIKEIVGGKNNRSYNLLSEEDRQRLAFLNNSNPYGGNSPSMMDTALIEESLSLLSDSEYDKTGDDLLANRSRRRSKRKSRQQYNYQEPKHVLTESTLKKYPKQPTAPPESEETDETTSKKKRRVFNVAGTSDETDDSLKPPPPSGTKLRRSSRNKMRRSLSVGDPIDHDDKTDSDSFFDIDSGRQIPQSATPRGILKKATADSRATESPPESPTIKRWASASKLHRAHNLFQKNVVKPETCSPCGKKIKFGRQAFKCKECKLASHVECRDRLSQLCIPADTTPTKGTQGNMISDFSPAEPPYVPGIILQCVNEVESRGLDEEGIYRKSGSEREVKELKDRFMKGKDPKLETIHDIHVVCGCLKDFLRNLKEPLVPTSSWTAFVNAASLKQEAARHESIRSIVRQLSAINRDCIAFLVIHLQRVSERSETKMSIDNLAKVFGPTIVGYSIPSPQPMQMISETRPQQMVMTAFMELDTDYWTNILASSSSEADYDMTQTPGQHHAVQEKKLKKFFGESPRYPATPSNRSYFPSPVLK